MANFEINQLPLESADAIAALVEGQRAWILEHLAGVDAPGENHDDIDRIRLKARWLLKIAEFFEKLSKTRDLHEMDNLLKSDLYHLQGLEKTFDFHSFPNYEKITTDAFTYCLAQANEPGPYRRTWRRHAITIKVVLGNRIIFDDSRIPGYSDAWKTAFVNAINNNDDPDAITIANITHGEVDLREIPDYEELVKARYYQLMFTYHQREDEVLKGALGDGLDFADRDQKIVDRTAELLSSTTDLNVVGILYILEKFGDKVHFGPDSIENFEQGVRTAFLWCLKHGNLRVDSAKKIKDKLGPGINYDDEVRAGIVYNLDQFKGHEDHWIRRAFDIREYLGKNTDLHVNPECQRAVVSTCMQLLQATSWRIEFIVSVKNQLGNGMRFSDETAPGYAAVVQKAFLVKLREGDVEDAKIIKDEFGQGVELEAENLDGYKAALRDGFISLISRVHPARAKALTDQFETGAEIEDKGALVQRQFIDSLNKGRGRDAIELKKEFPEMGCDREHIADYDDAFRACLWHSLYRSDSRDMGGSNELYETLGQGIDVISVLQKLREEHPEIFISFAKREHWKAIFGEAAFNAFLEALPVRTDEKRNAFTHNAYDRTIQFVDFLYRTGNFYLDDKEFALMTDFIRRFGLARSQNLYNCFCGLSKHEAGATMQKWIAEAGFKDVDDLEARIKALRQKVYSEEAIFSLSDLSSIELELLAVVTGKATHHFGGGPSIETITTDFTRAHAAGEIADLPDGYQVESIETSEISLDFDPEPIRADYEALRREIIENIGQPENINSLNAQSVHIIHEKLDILKRKEPTPFLADQIEKLEGLRERISAVKDLDALMKELLATKFMGKQNPFYSVMRQIVFRKIFMKNHSPEALADMVARLSQDSVTGQGILEIIGIVDDVVKHHVLNLDGGNKEKYWNNDTWNALRATRRDGRLVDIQNIFSPHIGNLRETAKKFEFSKTGKTATVRAIPDRGLVGEMSGYLANVCYTAEYPLLKPRPNLVPYKLVVGEGEESEFFGSYLTFELEQDNGDKVMLVRGFNVPDEASIDVAKFIEATFERLESVARKRGIKKIVIPGLMGALSNYPMTKNYLTNRYIAQKQPIRLKEEFVFNNYDLTENCFVVREIEQRS